jgi:uncharacterized membrane protein
MFRRHWAVYALVSLLALAWADSASAQSGPVAAYGFDEGSGTTTADASGNANTGTLSGATWNASGRYGSALTFNGTSDWVTVPDNAVLDLTGPMTIEAWVYPTSVGDWRSVLLKETSTGLSYGLYTSDSDGLPSGWIRRTSDIGVTGNAAVAIDSWVHLAVTYDGSALNLYVNGSQVATRAITGAIATSSQPLRIGGNASYGEFFDGTIDEVRIYNRALTASEIQTDMNTPVGSAASHDFAISATPGTQTVTQGGAAMYTVTATALNGFGEALDLAVSGLPANATATFTPASVVGAGDAALNVTTSADTPLGTSTLTITGTSGLITRTAMAEFVVDASPTSPGGKKTPDFSVSATPGSRSVTQGGATSFTVTIDAVYGFTGTVDLTVSGLPANATASFIPASMDVAGGADSGTLNVTTAANTPSGTATLTITGTSGALTHTTTVGLTVTSGPDFTISAAPGSNSVVAGGNTSYTVTIGGLNGFTETVNLSATGLPANASASFSPSSIVGSGSATLTVTTAAGTPAGTSTLTIVGASGSLTHSATANVVVSATSLGLAIGIHFVGTGTAMGATESAGVLPGANWNNATGASRTTALALADETGAPSGATVTWSSNNTWQTPIGDQAGNARLMKGYLDTADTSVTTVSVAGLANAAYDVYVYADGDNNSEARTGAYRISGTGITPTTISLTDAANTNFSSTFTEATNSAGNYVKFSIVASGFTLTATPGASTGNKRAPVNGVQIVPTAPPSPDFAMSATPGTQMVTPGGATSYTVTIGAVNGFTGTVDLAISGLPANATASLSPSSIPGGAGSATLTVTTAANAPSGTATLTITGTSGALTHTTTVGLTITSGPDFTISAAPSSNSVVAGGNTGYTVTIGGLNGFTGTVNLSATGLPASASASFSPSSIIGSGSATLTVTTAAGTPAGTSTLTIVGASGSLTHSATANLVVSSATSSSSGRAIGIDFVGAGASMGATESAGVVPKTNWNNAIGASRTTALALVDETGAPSGASVTWSSNNTWQTPIADHAGNARLMKGYLDTSDTSVTTVSVAGLANAAYDVYVYIDGDNASVAKTGAYRISGTGITTTTISLTDAANTNFSSAFTQATDSVGNYVKFSIVASGFTLTATPGASTGNKRAPVNAVQIVPTAPPSPDFAMSATPGTQTVTPGGAASYTVTIGAVNGFTETVNLAISGLPANAAASFSPASIPGGAGSATLTVTTAANTPSGTATLTITGTSGALTHATTATLVVNTTAAPDFVVSATPGTRTVTQGTGTSYSVTVGAVNGFTGQVNLSATGLPSSASAMFTPASVNGAGTSTLDVTTAATTPTGTWTVTIVGTSGAVTRSTSVSLTVTGATYSLSGVISPAGDGAGATVNLGGTAVASSTVNAAGSFSFAGLVNGLYLVTPVKSGFTFSPASRNVSVSSGNVTGVDFTAAQSANTISMSSPADGATVSSAFSMSAAASASIVAVQFQVDGVNAGPEDTSAPFSVSVTAADGSHTLRAIGRDASANTVTSASVTVTVKSGGSGTALAINGSQTFQIMDGFGVNLNSLSWKDGELAPALDRLVDELGAKTWRVVFDMMDWESTNDNADPNTPNWTYYNALYSNAKFQNLWGTLRYLNQKGVTSGIVLSFMGQVPMWMGGANITSTTAMEDEWVETVATLLYYARNTEHLQFDLLDPLNEPDWDGFEGPRVDQWQYVRLLQKLSVKLDAMGLGDVRFIGPTTAQITTGVDTYMPEMFTNSVVMSKLDHFGLHNYSGQAGGADARIKGSAYPRKNFWITELSIPEQIFTMIGQGAAAVQIWDAYDSVYNHAILAGAFYNDGRGSTPPNDAGNLAALMSYDVTSGVYSARPQFYQMQAFKYVMPGSMRISASESNSNLTVYAFRHPTTGRVTIIGRNIGSSSITLNGSLSGVGSIGTLQFYQTGISNNYSSFTRGSDAVVTDGSFTVTVPVNSYFTLTSQ